MHSDKTPPKRTIRFYEIDLLRFIAALGVVFFHYTFAGEQAGHLPFHFTLSAYTMYGYFGVLLFFMISGFVILMTALHRDWRGFVKSRIVRLYPMYWFAVFLTFVIIYLFGAPQFYVSFKELFWNLSMVQGYLLIPNIDEVYWTLGVEMMFYFHIFILLYTRKIRYIDLYLFGLLMISFVLETYNIKYISIPFFPEYSAYFIAGATAYLAYKKGWSIRYGVLYLLSYLLALYSVSSRTASLEHNYHVAYDMGIVVGILTLFFLLFLAISLDKTRLIRYRFMLYLGVVTYPLYLIHDRIGFVLLQRLSGTADPYLLVATVAVGMVLLAYILHKTVEQPFALLLKRTLDRFWPDR